MSTIGGIWISVEVTEQDGSHRDVVFPIAASDETLVAMIDARRMAYEELWAGAKSFNSIG
jgi:hypothetical protein